MRPRLSAEQDVAHAWAGQKASARAAIVVGVAAVYLVFGIMGMSLAIPPALATPLFPAAGVAVAAVLRYGIPGVAGVWVGQVVMQVVRHGFTSGMPTRLLLVCWSMLALGAALQAAVAVGLVRVRDARVGMETVGGRRLFALLFLSGMIACTVSASVGVATLTAAGFVDARECGKAWWEWYSGDTLGVFIFAPFIVMLLEKPDLRWSDDVVQALLRMGLVTILILAVFLGVRRWESRGIDVALRDLSLTIANGVAGRMAARDDESPAGGVERGLVREFKRSLDEQPLPAGLRLRLLHDRPGETGTAVFDSREDGSSSPGRRVTAPVPVTGGPWTLELTAGSRYENRGYDLSWAVALVSLFLTGILADRDLAAHAARSRETEAIVEKERIQRDLVIARDIQQGLLPKHGTFLAGFDIAGWNQPADETGGDYYDFVPLGDGLLAVAIADVTGHGIGAALVVAEVRALFRAEVLRSQSLDDVVARVHELVAGDLPDERLVTACFAVVSASRGAVSCLSAGHGPLLYREAGTAAVRLLRPQGLPIGFLPEPKYAEPMDLPMGTGDVFMVLTDGFVEWRDRTGRQFGLDRIVAFLEEHGTLPAAEIIGKLREAVSAFAGGTPQADDLTAVVVRRIGPDERCRHDGVGWV